MIDRRPSLRQALCMRGHAAISTGGEEGGKPDARRLKTVQKRALATRNKILAVAEGLFAEHGYDKTTTNMIAQAAGISIGSVYAHFKDKREIFLLIQEEHAERVYRFGKDGVEAILASNQDLDTAAGHIIRGLYESNRLTGRLNRELERFIQVDERAARLDARREQREDELIQRFLEHHRDNLRPLDFRAAATIINLELRAVFNYLFTNRGAIDEKAFLQEFTTMFMHAMRR